MRFFFGEAEYVQAIYSSAQAPTVDDPNIDGMVSFKNGTLCTLQACDVKHYLVFEFDIMGTKGRLKITRSGFGVEYYEPGESDLFSGYKELYPAEPTVDASVPRDFMRSAVGHIVECLHESNRPISSGDDGLAALELICAFHESASRDGTRVPLPLKDSNVIIKSR
jgi:predicted dehydrogenase